LKILLAVDGSKFTKKMLAYLATHADLFSQSGNNFVAFTASPPVPPRARAALGTEIVKKYHDEEAEKILAPVCKFLARHGIDAKSVHKVGAAGDAIAEQATQGRFDLVVMGSHGHGALASLVMGSVAARVLAQCEVPVMLVR
jgi:nucleotide-binding universal stress UspA family protein